jgi:hypothetical protein
VPCTSKNSAAALLLEPLDDRSVESLIDVIRAFVLQRFVSGSDPGFCVGITVPDAIAEFGERCQHELVTQPEARQLAKTHGLHLEGCGGTQDGVIGALAAVGLVAKGNDGRVVQIGAWPDDLDGPQDIPTLLARNVQVCCLDSGRTITSGTVDVGKHLRPNYRGKRLVLHARAGLGDEGGVDFWQAVRLD